MNIGKAIKELRKQQGMSQSELAKAAQITQAALSGIETGNLPNHVTMQKLSDVLGVPESLIYAMGIEKDDVPEEKKVLYDNLFPVIKSLVMQIATKD